MRFAALLAVSTISTAACSAGSSTADDAGTWVGTITTEGNVTTVVNESGSVWGGDAELVEEASIGVELGDDAYMLGYVSSLLVTDDRIFVGDMQVPVVRENPAVMVPDCEPAEAYDPALSYAFHPNGYQPGGACFIISSTIDVFGAGGRFLGSVHAQQLHPYSFIRDDTWVTPVESADGTIMVKRYRLVLPGEE
jgi:hypothetical protein